ncbi:MAG TPA: hypothetical protein VIG51_03915 [Candidatus Baltobacteraceae bacterium]|jgi:hypothetical protein|nr:hypothetical protein [Candidatus Baltobacteraceae bacterium]
MHKNDMAAVLTAFVGIGALASDAAFGQYLQLLLGAHAQQILAGLGMVGLLASTILRVLGSPSGTQPTVTIVQPLPASNGGTIITSNKENPHG